jgi:hypothetical protein
MVEHEAPECPDAAGVAALRDHVVDARRHECRVASERVEHEALVGVEHAGARVLALRLGAVRAEDARHDVFVHVELGHDRALLPVLGEEEAADLRLRLLVDGHRVHSQVSWRRSRKSLPARRRARAARRSARDSRAAMPTS